MATAVTYTKTGAKASKKTTLPKAIFAAKVTSHDLVHQVYTVQQSNARLAQARTKTRGVVSGGGRKPWRQKGLGRARVGSIRSPIWRGGGITFGPTGQENHSKKINAQAKQRALIQALSLKADAGSVVVIEDLTLKAAKTKELAALLTKLGITRQVTIVVSELTPELMRASSNLANVSVTVASRLDVKTVVDSDTLLMTQAAVGALEDRLGGSK